MELEGLQLEEEVQSGGLSLPRSSVKDEELGCPERVKEWLVDGESMDSSTGKVGKPTTTGYARGDCRIMDSSSEVGKAFDINPVTGQGGRRTRLCFFLFTFLIMIF